MVLCFVFFIIVPSKALSSEEGKKIQLPWTFEAKADFILDGDSVRVWGGEDKVMILISLYGIDCPEMDQPYGLEAKDFVEKALAKKNIKVTLVKAGRYNTALAYIHVEGKDLGYTLVENGLAEVDRGTARAFTEPEVKKKYLDIQKKARKSKTGMWIQGENYEYPLDFLRKQQGKKRRH